MGKGSNKIEEGVLGDESKEAKKVAGVGTEAIHSGIELGLNSGDGPRALRHAGKFLSLRNGGESGGQSVAEGEGKFEGQSGAKEEDGLTDACLAELNALGSTSYAKLLAAGSGKGASDGNEAVAVSIVFDDGENLIFAWQ
jgi:hypothetical protein